MGFWDDTWVGRAVGRIGDGENWSAAGSALSSTAGKLGNWAVDTALPWVGNAAYYTAATVGGEVMQGAVIIAGGAKYSLGRLIGNEEYAEAALKTAGQRVIAIQEAKAHGRSAVAGYAVYSATNPGEAITDIAQGITDGVVSIGGLVTDVATSGLNGAVALGMEDTSYQLIHKDHFFEHTASWNAATQFASEIQDDDPNRGYRVFNRVVGEVPGTIVLATVSGGTMAAAWGGARAMSAGALNGAKAAMAGFKAGATAGAGVGISSVPERSGAAAAVSVGRFNMAAARQGFADSWHASGGMTASFRDAAARQGGRAAQDALDLNRAAFQAGVDPDARALRVIEGRATSWLERRSNPVLGTGRPLGQADFIEVLAKPAQNLRYAEEALKNARAAGASPEKIARLEQNVFNAGEELQKTLDEVNHLLNGSGIEAINITQARTATYAIADLGVSQGVANNFARGMRAGTRFVDPTRGAGNAGIEATMVGASHTAQTAAIEAEGVQERAVGAGQGTEGALGNADEILEIFNSKVGTQGTLTIPFNNPASGVKQLVASPSFHLTNVPESVIQVLKSGMKT